MYICRVTRLRSAAFAGNQVQAAGAAAADAAATATAAAAEA
jgi:hypothetical protein